MPFRALAHLVRIDGPDAAAFLHAQLCSDVAALEPGRWQFGAWLSAQGRVRSFFHLLHPAPAQYVLVLRGGDGATLATALKRYVLRAKVSLAPGRAVLTCAAAPPAPPTLPARPLQAFDAGWLLQGAELPLAWRIDVTATAPTEAAPEPAAVALEIAAGVPWLPASRLDDLLPAALDFPRLGAISYAKGCYPGQEVAARLHFRGGNTRHLRAVRGADAGTDGQALRLPDGAEAGCLLQVGDAGTALAVLRAQAAAPGVQLDSDPGPGRVEVISALWDVPA